MKEWKQGSIEFSSGQNKDNEGWLKRKDNHRSFSRIMIVSSVLKVSMHRHVWAWFHQADYTLVTVIR